MHADDLLKRFLMVLCFAMLSLVNVYADIAVDPVERGLPIGLIIGIIVVVFITLILVRKLFAKKS